MAVLVTFRVSGDTDELLDRYDAAARELEERSSDGELPSPPDAILTHAICRTGDGMMVVDVWRSDEEARAFLDSDVWREALERHGVPQPDVEVYEVHRTVAANGSSGA